MANMHSVNGISLFLDMARISGAIINDTNECDNKDFEVRLDAHCGVRAVTLYALGAEYPAILCRRFTGSEYVDIGIPSTRADNFLNMAEAFVWLCRREDYSKAR